MFNSCGFWKDYCNKLKPTVKLDDMEMPEDLEERFDFLVSLMKDEKAKQTLILTYKDNLNRPQIAEKLFVNPSTVTSLRSKGLSSITFYLNRYEVIKYGIEAYKKSLSCSDEVRNLSISPKIINILLSNNICSISDLRLCSEQQLMRLKGLGRKGINELVSISEEYRLHKLYPRNRLLYLYSSEPWIQNMLSGLDLKTIDDLKNVTIYDISRLSITYQAKKRLCTFLLNYFGV